MYREKRWRSAILSRAVQLLNEFVTTRLDVARIDAHVFAQNKASMKVLLKNGFYLEAIHRKAAFKNNQFLDDYVWAKLV